MENRFCTNCGNHLNENERFCPNCGTAAGAAPAAPATPVPPVTPNNVMYVVRQPVPGRGMGITAMILGILGVIYSMPCLAMLSNSERMRDGAASLFILSILPILAICFGIAAISKKYKNGMSYSGTILGIVGLILFAAAGIAWLVA